MADRAVWSGQPIRVGAWKVDPLANEISNGTVTRHLEPKAMAVLSALAEAAAEVIPKEELIAGVWEGAFVTEHVLTRVISQLRKALGRDAENPLYIETIPRRGYRLVARVEALQRARPEGPRGLRSLAVLPLVNLSQDPEQEYFSDGLTDLLITELARIRSLRVTSRTSTQRFKEISDSIVEIGRQLGVESIIEGSVVRDGQRVRLSVQLIDAVRDSHLWADTFEIAGSDVLEVQKAIAHTVAERLSLELTSDERAPGPRPRMSAEALDRYLDALFHFSRRTPADLEVADERLSAALALEPDSLLVHLGLADVNLLSALYGWVMPREAYARASWHLRQATDLEPGHPQVVSVQAGYAFFAAWDLVAAEPLLEKAIRLAPSNSLARLAYADLLTATGRPGEALAEMETACRLNPLDGGMVMNMGDHHAWAGDLESGISYYERAAEVDPRIRRPLLRLARALAFTGAIERASEALERAAQKSGSAVDLHTTRALVHAVAGDRAAARRALALAEEAGAGRYASPLPFAEAWARLGAADEAFKCLRQAVDDRVGWMPLITVEPAFDPLRGDPRMAEILSPIRFPAPAKDASRGSRTPG